MKKNQKQVLRKNLNTSKTFNYENIISDLDFRESEYNNIQIKTGMKSFNLFINDAISIINENDIVLAVGLLALQFCKAESRKMQS